MDRLLFWMLAPVVLLFVVIGAVIVNLRLRQVVHLTLPATIEHASPIALRLAFLVYPIVCNAAFEVFACYEFENGRGWLVADVGIECHTDEHQRVMNLAWVAIGMYPVGLFVLIATLLMRARHDIKSNRKSRLFRATAFLHREYEPHFYWCAQQTCPPF